MCGGFGHNVKVLFLHGLESGPGGHKARWFAAHCGGITPTLSTVSVEAAVADAKAAIYGYAPDIVVGSSFGGAVLLSLLNEGVWRGPCLFLAQAGLRMTPWRTLPAGTRAILVHGRGDDIVPVEDSEALATTGGDGVRLVIVEDGHRLMSVLGAPLAGWLEELAGPG